MGACNSKADKSAVADVDYKIVNLQIAHNELRSEVNKDMNDIQFLKDEHTKMVDHMYILAQGVLDLQLEREAIERTTMTAEIVNT